MIFLVSALSAARVNLLMNDYASGLPSPMAFLGLGAAIAPELGADRWSVRVIPVLHSVVISSGRTKPEMVPGKKNPRRFTPLETAEDMTGMVRFSLVLDIPGCGNETAVAEALIGRTLAGGAIEQNEIVARPATAHSGILRGLPRGYAVVRPESPKLRIVSRGDRESLAEIARLLFPPEREPGSGWMVPIAVGHRLLEDPETVPRRGGTRSPDIPHVFAEPILGIAELVSIRNRRLTECTSGEFDDFFWQWNTFKEWILGHSAYCPEITQCAEKETS